MKIKFFCSCELLLSVTGAGQSQGRSENGFRESCKFEEFLYINKTERALGLKKFRLRRHIVWSHRIRGQTCTSSEAKTFRECEAVERHDKNITSATNLNNINEINMCQNHDLRSSDSGEKR